MKLASSLKLDTASKILEQALALAREESMLPMTVVVLDSGGRLVAMKSEDGSGLLRFDIALGKAWGAGSASLLELVSQPPLALHDHPVVGDLTLDGVVVVVVALASQKKEKNPP